jgi:glycyl-tRNA synthetase alpha subunit
MSLTFQEIVSTLGQFWLEQGCLILTPYNSEVGAGTMNPGTFLRVLVLNHGKQHISNLAKGRKMAVMVRTRTGCSNSISIRSF